MLARMEMHLRIQGDDSLSIGRREVTRTRDSCKLDTMAAALYQHPFTP